MAITENGQNKKGLYEFLEKKQLNLLTEKKGCKYEFLEKTVTSLRKHHYTKFNILYSMFALCITRLIYYD